MTRAGAALTLAALTLAAALAGCGSSGPAPTIDPSALAGRITVDDVFGHLQRLAQLADANDGSRADGTAGYDASVEYVAGVLRDNGFDVTTPEFERLVVADPGKPTLTVSGSSQPVVQASLLVNTPKGGLSAVTLRPRRPAGCTAADYGDANVRDAIAVVDDQGCSVVEKQAAATAAGAVGVLVVSDSGARGLFTPGYYQQLKAPVAVIGSDVDAQLRRTSAPVRLVLDARAGTVTSRNILAQTRTGDQHNVVMAGAHLDAPARSPGVNDNGSGVAAVLATAAALGGSPSVTNAVRFAFFGAGEVGGEGSRNYVEGLHGEGLADIALYLDFDMLGSRNAGYFTYDGDQSGVANPEVPAASVPKGSAGIERTLAGYLNLAGIRPADAPLGRTDDYSPFLTAGVPIGGLTTWVSGRKTEVQARLWGGQAGKPFDPAYRTPHDTIANVDRDVLGMTAPAVAFAVGTYAQSTDGVNGVPARG